MKKPLCPIDNAPPLRYTKHPTYDDWMDLEASKSVRLFIRQPVLLPPGKLPEAAGNPQKSINSMIYCFGNPEQGLRPLLPGVGMKLWK